MRKKRLGRAEMYRKSAVEVNFSWPYACNVRRCGRGQLPWLQLGLFDILRAQNGEFLFVMIPMLYSVLIPERDAGDELRQQLASLRAVLDGLGKPYELLCIDDGSAKPTLRLLENLVEQEPALRVLTLTPNSGLSAALAAGIAASRGDIIIVSEAGSQYPAGQIAELLHHLGRADLVFGQRRVSPLQKAWQRVARVPRAMLLGLEVKDPSCLFWAARREAIEQLPLTGGMYRYIPTFVVRRGYRVTETYIDHRAGCGSQLDESATPGDFFAAWWLSRRMQWPEVAELSPQYSELAAYKPWNKSA